MIFLRPDLMALLQKPDELKNAQATSLAYLTKSESTEQSEAENVNGLIDRTDRQTPAPSQAEEKKEEEKKQEGKKKGE